MGIPALVTSGVGPGSTIPLFLTLGLGIGAGPEPETPTNLTGRKVPWRSYRRGRLIDDETYWVDESQEIGESDEIVVKSATTKAEPLAFLVSEQLAVMKQAIEVARTDKIRKKRAKDLALFEQRIAEEEEEQEVLKLLLELMQ